MPSPRRRPGAIFFDHTSPPGTFNQNQVLLAPENPGAVLQLDGIYVSFWAKTPGLLNRVILSIRVPGPPIQELWREEIPLNTPMRQPIPLERRSDTAGEPIGCFIGIDPASFGAAQFTGCLIVWGEEL